MRLLPGVLGNQSSLKEETFSNNLLEYPQYTKPRENKDLEVPNVLLYGNHKEIKKWRKEVSTEITIKKRPDLLNHDENDK